MPDDPAPPALTAVTEVTDLGTGLATGVRAGHCEGDVATAYVSVVLPVHNEQENLIPLDAEIRAALLHCPWASEILYVDDGSRDASPTVLEGLVASARASGSPIRTRLVRLRRNYGQTAAMAAGFELATGAIILPMDADRQNNPADIPRLVATLEGPPSYDVVSGWRKDRKDKAISRRFPSMIANIVISSISGTHLHDYGCTLKAYRATYLKELMLYGEMHRFIPVYLGILGARVGELVVDHRPRVAGVSKYGAGRVLRVLLDVVLIRFMTKYYTRPLQFFGKTAALFGVAALFTFIFMLVLKFGIFYWIGVDWQADFVQTPLPALAATFLLGMMISLFFGILAEVLVRIHYESRGARPYAVSTIQDSHSCEP